MASREAQEIVAFWRDAGYDKWFSRDDAFDAEIAGRFAAIREAAAAGQLAEWEADAEGALALLILLDQFPRNMFRGQARAFATDATARGVADRAIAKGFDAEVEKALRDFFYLPFMHSENLADQERCIALFRACADEKGEGYAVLHHALIKRFGRFPHRNEALQRKTTPEEAEFLAADASSQKW